MRPNESSGHHLSRKVVRRFYEPVLILYMLDQIRGPRLKAPREIDVQVSETAHRRHLADGIAYICAYKRQPAFMTAVALERTPEEVVVWLAANGGVSPEAVYFVKEVLSDLEKMAQQSNVKERKRAASALEGNLAAKSIIFGVERSKIYHSKAATHAKRALTIIRSPGASGKCGAAR